MDTIQTVARNATLDDIVELLALQQDVKYDAVVGADRLQSAGGFIQINDATVGDITDDGVDLAPLRFRPTDVFDEGLSAKLGVPRKYLRRMRDEGATDLLDHNVNHWLSQAGQNYLVRAFHTGDAGYVGVARAFLSDQYGVVDHLDALMAALDGINAAGVNVQIDKADLSERNLRVILTSPEIEALAPEFTRNYRSPFNGNTGRDLPVVQAGLEIRNSETGGGAFVIAPRIVVLVCNNGMTRNVDALRKVHLGSKMEATNGPITWSAETQNANVELIRSQTKDAVTSFLSQRYIDSVVETLETQGKVELDKPKDTLERVTSQLRYTDAERDAILDMFIKGGDTRAAGVAQAITAYAQSDDVDPDRAAELEGDAFEALALAARS